MRELCDLLEEVADSTAAVCARRTCGVGCVGCALADTDP